MVAGVGINSGGIVVAIKLVACDLDGTLLNRRHMVSPGNREIIRRAVERGVVVTLATGRMFPSALPHAEALSIDVPIITYNGAMIRMATGEVVNAEYIEPDVCRKVFAFCRARQLYLQVYRHDKLYFYSRDELASQYERAAGVTGFPVGEKLYELSEEVPKMLLITDSDEQSDRIVAELKELMGDAAYVTKSNPEYIEIIDPKVNKGVALRQLMERFKVREEEVMAIGDSNNDIAMFTAAGLKVAMANADAHIKALCDVVTLDCDADGVGAAIEKYVLN